MNEHIEYAIQVHLCDGSWIQSETIHTDLDETKRIAKDYEVSRIVMRRVTDWCEVKEGAME